VRPLLSSGVETIGGALCCLYAIQGAPFAVQHLTGLVRYQFGVRGRSLGPLQPSRTRSEWTTLIADVLDRELGMSQEFRAHSERTYVFAHAIARARPGLAPKDHQGRVDDEVLYAACLLHDAGLFDEHRARCFAIVGADLVRRTADGSGIGLERAEAAALAVAGHVDVRPRTPFASLLRSASLADVIGYLTWDIDPVALRMACKAESRHGFTAAAERVWAQEVERFPYGRAAFARRPGGMVTLMRLNPLDRSSGRVSTHEVLPRGKGGTA